MKKLCIGTYIHLICQAKSNISQKDFLETLLTFNDKVWSEYAKDPTLHTHLKNGTDNITTEYAGTVRHTDSNDIFRHIATKLVPLLDVHKHKQLVLAFRAIINEDTTIPDDCLIGTSEGYTKSNILSKNNFSLPGLLTNLFIYCTTQVENKKFKNNIKEIPSNFVDSFNDEVRSININESLPITPVPIDSTVKREKFDSVFTEVIHPQTLNLPNPSTVKLYHLNVADYSFTHDQISKFIKDNLGRYVFSRAKRNEYQINDEMENIALDAATAMRKSGEIPTASHFGEIMLYSFLESVLNAPKLMSKVELQNAGGGYTSKCSGVHLLSLDNGKLPIYQLVFGCTDIFVLTPERLLYLLISYPNININYLFIDESHKISARDGRSAFYYKVVDMLAERPIKPHIIFASPNIPNPEVYLKLVPGAPIDQSAALSTSYSPVSQLKYLVDLVQHRVQLFNERKQEMMFIKDLNATASIPDTIKEIISHSNKKQSIVYFNSRDTAIEYAVNYADSLHPKNDPVLDALAKEIQNEIHDSYYLAELIQKGVAYHVGYLPMVINHLAVVTHIDEIIWM